MVTNNSVNTYIVPSTNREVTMPSQPAFSARASAQNDVTGDATVYTAQWTNEIFDQNSDFDGTSTFTAPVTGRYSFIVIIAITGIEVAMTAGNMTFVTSNRTYYNQVINYGAVKNSGNQYNTTCACFADMDAGDTAIFQFFLQNGTKAADLAGGYFLGYLVC